MKKRKFRYSFIMEAGVPILIAIPPLMFPCSTNSSHDSNFLQMFSLFKSISHLVIVLLNYHWLSICSLSHSFTNVSNVHQTVSSYNSNFLQMFPSYNQSSILLSSCLIITFAHYHIPSLMFPMFIRHLLIIIFFSNVFPLIINLLSTKFAP